MRSWLDNMRVNLFDFYFGEAASITHCTNIQTSHSACLSLSKLILNEYLDL